MKKLYIVLPIMCFAFVQSYGQVVPPVLTYENHALIADQVNKMKLTEYVDPGNAGANQTWNFSGLQQTQDFRGQLINSYSSGNADVFPSSNIELSEFNNKFYFKLTETSLEQYGIINTEGTMVEKYDQAIVRIVYPFAYGDAISGNFSGTYHYDVTDATITGTYSTEADAYGKLILPQKTFDNTLRVKTTKTYTRANEGSSQDVSIVTYRWYNAEERFPLLVLTTVVTPAGTSNQAAYRSDFGSPTGTNNLQLVDSRVYPNPFSNEFKYDYITPESGIVTIELLDITGRSLSTLLQENQLAGEHNLVVNDLKIASGSYMIKTTINGKSSYEKIVKVE